MSQKAKKDKEAQAPEKPVPAKDKPVPAKDPDQGAEEGLEKAGDRPEGPPGPDWEKDLDEYPLRESSQDPKWAVRTVWIWVGFGLVSLTFILVMLVLGALHD